MSRRTEQVNKLIKEEISQLLLRELEFPKGVIATVTRVKVSPDLKYAKIFVSIFPSGQGEKILEFLEKNASHLQFLLAKKIVMKFVPKISFVLDVTEEEAEKIEEIFKEI